MFYISELLVGFERREYTGTLSVFVVFQRAVAEKIATARSTTSTPNEISIEVPFVIYHVYNIRAAASVFNATQWST